MVLGEICVTPLWNQSVSWDTNDPYLSECFKHLVLVVGSCAVLWVVAPFEFIKICQYQGSPSPWTRLSISKITCKILLLIICVIELIKEVYAYVTEVKYGLDGLIAAVAYFVTIVLTVILTMMCKKRGIRSSLALPSFWMISTITTLISIYDDIHTLNLNEWVSCVSLIDDTLAFFISVMQLILSSMSENVYRTTGRQFVKYCPLDGCSLLSRLTYGWLLSLIAKSTASSLHQDHLINQCSELRSTSVSSSFNKIWKKNSNKMRKLPSEDSQNLLSEDHTTTSPPRDELFMSLLNAIMKVSKKYLIISSILEIIYTGLYFLPTYLLRLILSCEKEEEWHKYLYATSLSMALLLCTFADSQRKYYGLVAAIRIKTALMNAIFEKALVSHELQDVHTHLHENAENVFQMVCLATEVWGAPIRICIGLYLLWYFVGSACFIGIAAAAFLIPLTTLLENLSNFYHEKSLTVKSKRLDVFREILHGMKVIKIYAWEEFFLQKVLSLRKLEINGLRKAVLLRISFKFMVLSSALLVSLATFTVYILMGNSVDVKRIFIALYLIHLLKTPFTSLLRLLAYFVQGLTSVSHIQKFLDAEEIASLLSNNTGCKISLTNVSFAWNKNREFCLKHLNFNVRESTLIAIVGDEKSGKSSFLRAVMGQMQKIQGFSIVEGQIAYVSDSPWIQNTTLEKNIIFLKPKVNAIYRRTIEACRLVGDIDILPEGEETEIGEKGYELNEEQKLKVDLARAVYQNAEIYLIDDPFRYTELSSAEHLYQRVIGRGGILKEKIRIFTSRDTRFLPLVDHILFLQNGCIVEQGNYSELLDKNGYLSKYIKTCLNTQIKKNAKITPQPKNIFNFNENMKDHCDPWYTASGMALKPEVASFLHCEISDPSMGLFQKILKYMRMNGYCIMLIAVLVSSLACCCEAASWMWWTKWLADSSKEDKLYKNVYTYAGIILIQVFCTIVSGIFIFIGSTSSVGTLHTWLWNRIMRASVSTFGPNFIEKVCLSFDKDLQFSDEKIPMSFYMWLLAVIKAPVLLFVIFFESPILWVFSIPLMLAYFATLKLYLNTWRQLHHLTAATRCPLNNLLKEALHGKSNIRAYNASIHYITRFQIKLDTHNNCYFLFLLVSRWVSTSTEIIGSLFVLLTTVIIFVEKAHDSNFVGLVIVFSMQIAESLIALTYMSSLLDVDLMALERLCSFSRIKEEAEWENPTCDLPNLWPTSGQINIEHLSTTYAETLYPGLNNINMTIQPNEKVAIVGKENSGIYTILDSLYRIREITQGQIFIDNIDISNIGLHDLRTKLAFIPQDPFLFNGTLRENLDPRQKYQDEDLHLAMTLAKLDYPFTDLNKSIEDSISLEDKHRISYVRCLLQRPKIVIFDKPRNSSKYRKMLFPSCTHLNFMESEVLDSYDRTIHISSGEIVEIFPEPTTSHH